ncbi:MAG: HAD family hydrolase [Calditrichaeota bacterium]|nr:HAD family hydrolase [Calditrichota bacterium]
MMIKPKCILFDFGETIMLAGFDRRRWVDKWLELADNPRNVTFQMVWDAADELIDNNPARMTVHSEFRRTQFDLNLCERLGVSFNITSVELDIELAKVSYRKGLQPHTVEMLEKLKESGIEIGMVSNCVLSGKSLEDVLERNGIREYFNFVIASSDYGFRKPNPQIFKTALAKSGTSAEETWYVGDKLEFDIAGATGVGVTAVWYNAREEVADKMKPDIEVKD